MQVSNIRIQSLKFLLKEERLKINQKKNMPVHWMMI